MKERDLEKLGEDHDKTWVAIYRELKNNPGFKRAFELADALQMELFWIRRPEHRPSTE